MTTATAPLITTVIPTYQRPRLLRRAILSVLAQKGPPLQVCVYDNASQDDTARMVEELRASDPRVKYHRHERNIGFFENFQFGLAQVRTPFFSMLSDDDFLLPGFFERALQGLETHPGARFWMGTTVRLSTDGTVYDALVEQWPEGLHTPPEGLVELARRRPMLWTGVVFRKQCVDDVGVLDPEVHGPTDFDFILRVGARHPFVVSRQAVAVFMLNPESFSENGPFAAFWPGWTKLVRNATDVAGLPPGTRAEVQRLLNAAARRMLLRRGAAALSKGDYAFARNAAEALRGYYRRTLQGGLLQVLAAACSRLPVLQRLYTAAYQAAVRQLLHRRSDLQQRYGYLARHL